MDRTNGELRKIEKNYEYLKAYIDGKIENMQFDCARRVKIDDMKQNFK